MSETIEQAEDRKVMTEWLIGELYGVDPSQRALYVWKMNAEWLDHTRQVLGEYWEPNVAYSKPPYLCGKDVIVDEDYTVPRMVKRDD